MTIIKTSILESMENHQLAEKITLLTLILTPHLWQKYTKVPLFMVAHGKCLAEIFSYEWDVSEFDGTRINAEFVAFLKEGD